ncbi:hypothetical protein TNIN_478651 [Trichonephila inaurata madagascariensis]|uniref:Uncharacterized protein n=1 Tax=Trichonephila inaurata madagascariensis TaxID=2747483 RepID=A0A8X6XNJ7_9ARAC|nr:hypothetical protein TNIN_478651 [Trichonephila inaurata madagascariensis]
MRSRSCEWQQNGAEDYGYSDRNSKITNGNTFFCPKGVGTVRASQQMSLVCTRSSVRAKKRNRRLQRRKFAYDRVKKPIIERCLPDIQLRKAIKSRVLMLCLQFGAPTRRRNDFTCER